MRARLAIPAAALALLTLAAAAFALRPDPPAPAGEPAAEHVTPIPEERRTVRVSVDMPAASPAERLLTARLEEGPMPADGAVATVLTDTDCEPDVFGVSRCRNEVRLEDGTRIVLRHPHRMAAVPCLAPGERVVLRRA